VPNLYTKEVKWRVFILFLVLFNFNNLLAQESLLRFDDAVTPELVTSARARAMGNAFISKVDDSAASFYNPAGLGTIRKTHFHLSNFHVEANKGWFDAGLGGKAFKAVGKFTSALDEDGLRELLEDSPGTLSYNRFQLMPNFTTRYFSLGYLYSKQSMAMVVRDEATEALTYDYIVRRDHGPYASMNLSFWGGIFKIGFTGVFLQRKEADGSQPADEAVVLEDGDYYKGLAFHGITGLKFTLPWKYLPTFSVVSHNTFGNQFSARKRALGQPESIPSTIDVGFSLIPQISNLSRLHFEFNYKDVAGEVDDVKTLRKMLFGVELDVARSFFIRLGYGDGYGSAGMGVRAQKFEVDLSTYAVETSGREFAKKEDRRFALSLSSGF
jgi:hypothetical protein